MFSRSATFDELPSDSVDCSNAHSSLSVSSKSVLSSECVPAETRIWFRACMNFGMPLEIVSTDEALVAVITLELSIVKVSLHVRFDVLFPAETLVAIVELANPLVVRRIWPFYVLCNIVQSDVSLLDGSADAWFEVEV
jgi:hypothetical protein